jgi:hypothetical protein
MDNMVYQTKIAMLWIWSDRHYFERTKSVFLSTKRKAELYFFSKKFLYEYTVQNIESYDGDTEDKTM